MTELPSLDDPADVLMALGLAHDPVAEAKSRAKAAASMHGSVPRELCETCGNQLPSHGVCRRKAGCRAAARERAS